MLASIELGATVKKDIEPRSDRRKDDEDIAERISLGVRLERASSSHERDVTRDASKSPATANPHKRRRPRR
jgi:hypothetical protein